LRKNQGDLNNIKEKVLKETKKEKNFPACIYYRNKMMPFKIFRRKMENFLMKL
jgi:hypothetical protein